MSVARVTEISSTSTQSFEDAIQQGIARATQSLRGRLSDQSAASTQ
jgi:dodecin